MKPLSAPQPAMDGATVWTLSRSMRWKRCSLPRMSLPELKSLKKKFKDKKFAAGCSREIITQGAQLLGWDLDQLLDRTLCAMREEEQAIEAAVEAAGAC